MSATPMPWATSDSQPTHVFHDAQGIIDPRQPVAVFRHAEDARAMLRGLDDAAKLRTIREAAKAYDNALNDGGDDFGPQSPTGDDYNALFSLFMADAPANSAHAAALDTLAALRDLVTQKTRHPGRVESASHLWDAALYAIAKAEGRANG